MNIFTVYYCYNINTDKKQSRQKYVVYLASFSLLCFLSSRSYSRIFFEQLSLMHESGLPRQLRCRGSCQPHGRVQVPNPGGVHWGNTGYCNICRVFKASKWIFLDSSIVKIFLWPFQALISHVHMYVMCWK